LHQRTVRSVLYVDVELQAAASGVAQRHLNSAEIFGMEIDPHALVARQSVKIGLMRDLGHDLARMDLSVGWHGRGVRRRGSGSRQGLINGSCRRRRRCFGD
jgi:hypothetical protein